MARGNTLSNLSEPLSTWFRQSEQTPVILVFSSAWSGSAHILMSYLKVIQKEYENIRVYQVDVEKKPELAQRFGISSIPTTIFLKNRKMVKRLVGSQSKKKLQQHINALI